MWDKATLVIAYFRDKFGDERETPLLHRANGGSVTLKEQSDHELAMLQVASTDETQPLTALLHSDAIVLRRDAQATKWQYVSVDTESVFVSAGDTITEIRPDSSV